MADRLQFVKRGRSLLLFLVALVILGGLYLFLAPVLGIGGVTTPAALGPVTIRLDQGWSDDESLRFHHATQGARILPLSWFMALEQPVITPLPVGRLADRGYLGGFGFLYESKRPNKIKSDLLLPDLESATPTDPYTDARQARDDFDLPIGFAIDRKFKAPYTDPPIVNRTVMVGLTCAACHTGRIDVKLTDGSLKSVMIDGGSSMIHITNFQQAVKQSLFFTQFFSERFQRFASNVLGESLPGDDLKVMALKRELDRYIELGLASEDFAREHKLNSTASGYARTDALGLIGNRVFGVLNEDNQVVTDAPVNFPQLWDTPWFDWVQYNGSIRTPLARNIGEALGVGAVINLKNPVAPLYDSSVDLANLAWMEDTLGGDDLFEGLQSPKWKDMGRRVHDGDPPVDSPYAIRQRMADAGKVLYDNTCIRCHLPPRAELAKIADRSKSEYFSKPDPGSNKRFLRLNIVDLNTIGTDPNQAINFYRRIAVAPEPVTRAYSERDDQKAQQRVDDTKMRAKNEKYPFWSRVVRQGTPGSENFATISAEDGLFRVTSMIRRLQYKSWQFQLLPMDVEIQKLSEDDEGDVLRAGSGVVVLALVGDTLHCRVFDMDGRKIIDRVERDAQGKPADLQALKQKLQTLPTGRRADGLLLSEIAVIFFPEKAEFTSETLRAEARRRWDRYRYIPKPLDLGNERAIIEAAGMDWVIKANLGYRARPHDGIWATPPYLHNGSVPNLFEMLVPADKRTTRFYLGSTRFDPVHVGYETIQFHGGFEMDTNLPGNTNTGHEFRNLTLKEFEDLRGTPWDGKSTPEERWTHILMVEPSKYKSMDESQRKALITEATRKQLDRPQSRSMKGVLGPEYTDDERWQLVEYLKTL